MHWIEYLTILIYSFAIIRLIIVFINLFLFKKLPSDPILKDVFVDVLIPARNEAENIGFLLNDLEQQTYTQFKVWVYDDDSSDNTAEIVREHIKRGANIELVKGKGLKEGWTGKNNACNNLAGYAGGDAMIFLDADVRLSNNFIKKTISYFIKNKLHLVSFFPDQKMVSFGEKLIVPLMNWILISILPLFLVRRSSWTSFVAANGQCMVFNTREYQQNKWHEQVRNIPVEDIAIMKLMKKRKLKVDVLLGQNEISCRMYRSYETSMQGLSRSAPAFFGYNIFGALCFILLVSFGPLFIYWSLSWPFFIGFLLIILVSKAITAYQSNQSVWDNLLLHPLHLILLPVVVVKGLLMRLQGRYNWKGRQLKLD